MLKIIYTDYRTPLLSKILLGAAILYFALPFDIIPDFIPVLGQIDDIFVIWFLVFLAFKILPPELKEKVKKIKKS